MIFEVIKGTGLLVLALLADPVAAQAPTPAAARAIDAAALYQQHCASCHGEQRLGGMGPATAARQPRCCRLPAP